MSVLRLALPSRLDRFRSDSDAGNLSPISVRIHSRRLVAAILIFSVDGDACRVGFRWGWPYVEAPPVVIESCFADRPGSRLVL